MEKDENILKEAEEEAKRIHDLEAQAPVEQPAEPTQAPEPKKDNKLPLILLAVLILAIGGFAVWYFVLGGNGKSSSKKEEPKQEEKKEETKEDNNEIIEPEEQPVQQPEPVQEGENKEEEKEQKNISTFSIDNETGIAYVEGYATIEHKEYYNEEGDYIFFNIIKTDSNDLMQFIEGSQGNSYVGDKAIGLGCKNDDIIQYYNHSDEAGFVFYKLDEETTNNILNSTEDTPIKLKLERLRFTGGGEAPLCYSHITYVSIAE